MQSKKVIREIETLKADTSRVIKDLTLLTSALTEETGEDITKAAESVRVRTAEELKHIRQKLGALTNQTSETAKRAATHIRENPYPWLAGVIGVGLVFGALSLLRRE